MEKRALIAIAVSFVILLVWSYVFPPPRPNQVPQPLPQSEETAPGSMSDPTTSPPSRSIPAEEPGEATGSDDAREERDEEEQDAAEVAAATVEEQTVKNDHFTVVFTNLGGAVRSWRLHEYTTSDGAPLELMGSFEGEQRLPLALELDDPGLTDTLNEALYQVERRSITAQGSGTPGESLTFRWSDGRGLEATKRFTIWRDGWLVDVDVDVVDRGRRLPARLSFGPGFASQEPHTGRSTYAYTSQGVWNVSGNVTRKKKKKLVGDPGSFSAEIRWGGLEDQYFTALLLPAGGVTNVQWRSVEVTPLPLPGVETTDEIEPLDEPLISISVPEDGARLFIGPKKFSLLRSLGNDLDKSVWFATNVFLAAISRYIFFALVWIHDTIAPNYGLAIILATALLRIMLFPVNQYSMVSMKKMQIQSQRLQPKMKAIKGKYTKKKDAKSRQKMNEEIMDLYRREGVNPAGGISGCLPMLAQFPILIGFYNMLTVAVELRGANFFGWINDLSQKDPYWIIPLLMGVTMFLQQKMAMSKVKDPTMQQQQKIMMFMPFFFTWICLQMPAGMVLYWFVNNLLGIGQQWLVNRHTGRLEAAAAQKV